MYAITYLNNARLNNTIKQQLMAEITYICDNYFITRNVYRVIILTAP
jgi:hypothetical protein